MDICLSGISIILPGTCDGNCPAFVREKVKQSSVFKKKILDREITFSSKSLHLNEVYCSGSTWEVK